MSLQTLTLIEHVDLKPLICYTLQDINMLTIRLQRTGTKNKPAFRIVLAEAHKSVSKKFLEVLGSFNPKNKSFGVKNEERLKYWIAQNVQISPTVYNLLVDKKFVEGKKVKAWQPKKSASGGKEKQPEPSSATSTPQAQVAQAPPAAETPTA